MTGPTSPPHEPTGNITGPHDGRADGVVGRQAGSARRELMLSELAAELRAARDEHCHDVTQLRNDLGGLSTLVRDNADLLGQVLPRVTDLDEQLCAVAARLDVVAGALGDDTSDNAGPPPVLRDWPSLSAEAAAAEWQALGDWVAGVLGPFYELTRAQLPDCWPLHRPAVLELVWLRRIYVAAHRSDATAAAAADWHTRWRREALANIAAAIPKKWCRPGEHLVDQFHPGPRNAGPPPPPPRPPQPNEPGQRPGPGHAGFVATEQISTPEHWGQAFDLAAAADIARRRHRDATGDRPLAR